MCGVNNIQCDVRMKKYTIRREVLNVPMDMWNLLIEHYGKNFTEFVASPESFVSIFGLPSGMSALYNDEEKEFFEKVYKL
jgi:hypothetical protein